MYSYEGGTNSKKTWVIILVVAILAILLILSFYLMQRSEGMSLYGSMGNKITGKYPVG